MTAETIPAMAREFGLECEWDLLAQIVGLKNKYRESSDIAVIGTVVDHYTSDSFDRPWYTGMVLGWISSMTQDQMMEGLMSRLSELGGDDGDSQDE